jgi:tripartite-type tricarboxylate transporter receptor subunit TctC
LAAGAAALIGIGLLAGGAQAQTARTIRIVVPLAEGGAASVVGRVLADEFAAAHRVTTVVENRPGAGTAVGKEAVASAAPDGNTLPVNNPGILANALLRKQNYDPLTSLEPICKLADQPTVLAVNSGSPYGTLNDFIATAREKPGQLTVATFGVNIALEEFKRRAKADIRSVPYPGSASAVTDLLGGKVGAMVDNLATMGDHVKAGKLRALATFAPARIEGWDQIPTFAEAGYNEFMSWWGLFAPAKTPGETASELIRWTAEAMQKPDVKQKLMPLGLYPARTCGADFATLLHHQYEDFGRVIREANIKAD